MKFCLDTWIIKIPNANWELGQLGLYSIFDMNVLWSWYFRTFVWKIWLLGNQQNFLRYNSLKWGYEKVPIAQPPEQLEQIWEQIWKVLPTRMCQLLHLCHYCILICTNVTNKQSFSYTIDSFWIHTKVTPLPDSH